MVVFNPGKKNSYGYNNKEDQERKLSDAAWGDNNNKKIEDRHGVKWNTRKLTNIV